MICKCRIVYILVCIWETFWNVMHAQFAALKTLPTTEPRCMPIVSRALIYDTAIRVSAVTADRTGKFALLTYSLTAYHCSTEARLAGVHFPPHSTRAWCWGKAEARVWKVSFDVDAKLSRVAKEVAKFRSGDSDVCAENFSHSARLLLQQSRASYMLAFCLRAVLISSPDTRVERGCTRWL